METKRCSDCGEIKSIDEFYKSKARGSQTYCKKCANRKRAQWARDNVEKTRGYKIKYAYGIGHEEYEAMIIKQGGACAVCREPFTKVANIDHDHTTGAVRGLLCTGCNVFIGHIECRDLAAAVAYLNN